MELSEWADQYFVRNAKLKGWTIEGSGDDRTVVASGKTLRYRICETLDAITYPSEECVIVTLNTKKNIAVVQESFDLIPDHVRFLFVNPQEGFWSLNVGMIVRLGDPEAFKKSAKKFRGEVPLVR